MKVKRVECQVYLTEFPGSSIDTSLAASVHDTSFQMEIRQITQLDWNVPCPACIEIDNIYVNSNPYSTRIFFTLKNGKLFFPFFTVAYMKIIQIFNFFLLQNANAMIEFLRSLGWSFDRYYSKK